MSTKKIDKDELVGLWRKRNEELIEENIRLQRAVERLIDALADNGCPDDKKTCKVGGIDCEKHWHKWAMRGEG